MGDAGRRGCVGVVDRHVGRPDYLVVAENGPSGRGGLTDGLDAEARPPRVEPAL